MGVTSSKPKYTKASEKKEAKSTTLDIWRDPTVEAMPKCIPNVEGGSVGKIILDYWNFDFDENETLKSSISINATQKWSFFKQDPLPAKAANYLVWGNPDKLEKIITINPYVLLVDTEASDHISTLRGKLLKMALDVKDVLIKNAKGETMAGMIKRHLKEQFGEEEVLRQLEQFRKIQAQETKEKEEKNKEKKYVTDKIALDTVWLALNASTAADAKALAADGKVTTAINEFKTHLRNQGDDQIHIDAWKLFEEKYAHFGRNNSPKNNLFCNQIIASIQLQRFRVWELQVFQGLYYYIRKDFAIPRTDISSRSCIYPTDGSRSRIGFDSHFDLFGLRRVGRESAIRRGVFHSASVFGKFLASKNLKLAELIQQPSHSNHGQPSRERKFYDK